ncbi:MAG: hypothetical protein KGQ28_09210, partial [Hyphomicrobiales bacterium]|nr:hypothetical protein [Hyphomicrobiales bacterium]
ALGWLRLHQQGCGYAIGWFRDAVAWSPGGVGDAKTREGLAQAYRASMRWHDAEDEAFALSGAVPAMRKLYEDVAIEELTRPWPSIPMSERRVGRFAALVMADKSARGAQALGWRRHDEPRSGYGVAWFARAIAWAKDAKPDVKTAEGYALALRHAGRFKDAEEVAFPFVAAVPAMRKLYVEDVVEQLTRDTPPEPMEEARIARFKSVFEPDKSPLAAQALAWYRHGRHEDAAARRWFKTALDWWPPVDLAKFKALPPQDAYVPILAKLALVPSDYRPTPLAYAPPPELTGKPDAAYAESPEGYAKTWEGYALALQATGDAAQAAKIAWEWRDRWPALRRLFVEVAMAELSGPDAAKLDATQVERFGAAIDLDKSSSGAAALGWFQLRSKSFDAASRWFDKALAWAKSSDELAATPEIQQGYVLALRGAGRDAEALAAAAKWRNANPAVNGLYVDAALAAVAKGGAKPGGVDMKNLDMADVESAVGERKSPDAALALGWSLYSAKDFAGATKWFGAALAWSPADKPSPKALEGQVRALAASGRAADAAIAAVKAAASAPDLRKVAVDSALGRLDAAYAGGADAPTPVLADVGKALSALKSSRGAADFAWKRVMRRDWPAAAAWFGAAVAWSPTAKDDPKVAEGRSIALRAIGRFDEADSALMPFIGKSDAMRDLFIGGVAARLTRKPPSPPPAAEMRTFAKLALDSRSALGAEALGWYAFNVRQYVPARDWFAKALEWRPSEGAARGLLMSYRGLGDHFGYGSALATWGAAFPDLMRAAPPASPTPAAYVPGDATGTPAATMRRPTLRRPFARTEAPSGAAAGRLAEGWRLLKLDRPQEAARAFEDALARGKGRTASDAAYGRSLALLRNGETSA